MGQDLKDEFNKLVQDWIEYWSIFSDPSKNTRDFRKAVATGEHPLSYVTFKEAEYIKNEPEIAWSLVLELVANAQSEKILALIAAGPLEDLLNRYPEQYIKAIEEQARKNKTFKKCLSGVWESRIPKPIWKRILNVTDDRKRL